MKKNNMRTTGRVLDKIFKWIQLLNLIGGAVCLCGLLIIFAGYGAGVVKPANSLSVNLGNLTLEVAGKYTMENRMGIFYGIMLGVLLIIGVAEIYIACHFIRKILKPVAEKKPFDDSVAENFKKLGYTVLICGILENVCDMIKLNVDFTYFGLKHLAESDYVRSVTQEYHPDTKFLVLFLILLLVTYIFCYGAELQQLSDETL